MSIISYPQSKCYVNLVLEFSSGMYLARCYYAHVMNGVAIIIFTGSSEKVIQQPNLNEKMDSFTGMSCVKIRFSIKN